MGLIPDFGDPSDPLVRARYGYLQAGVAMAVNFSLFASKLFLASMMASVAVLTDSFNQLGDVGISAIILIAFRYSVKRPDAEHPFGHGRLEDVAALLVASFLVVVAIFLVFTAAAELPSPSVQGTLQLAIVLAALAAVKELLARFSFSLSRRIDSDALRGDAWNHRFDAMLTGAIALAIYLASLQASLRVLDPVFGLVVSVIILYNGGKLIRSAGDRLLGRAPSQTMVQEIESLASKVRGVSRVHSVAVHDYGTRKVVSLTIEVDDRLSVAKAHEIATSVERRIKSAIRSDATVHVEPSTPPPEAELIRLGRATAAREGGVHSVEDVKFGLDGRVHLRVRIPGTLSLDAADEMETRLTNAIEKAVDRKVEVSALPCEPDCGLCSAERSERGSEAE